MKSLRPSISYLVLLLSFACKDAELSLDAFPVVEMVSANAFVDGARFSATIISKGSQPILKYGFIWSEDSTKSYDLWANMMREGDPDSTTFSSNITYDLKPDMIYYVRPLMITSNFKVVGNVRTFKSNGSRPPIVKDFYPKKGVDFTTVTLLGENFSSRTEHVRISINDINTTIISSSKDSITFQIPKNQLYGAVKIKLECNELETVTSEDFILSRPTINILEKKSGKPSEEVSIFGEFFTSGDLLTSIYLGTYNIKIISKSESEIRIKIPTLFNHSQSEISILPLKIIVGERESLDTTFLEVLPNWEKRSETLFNYPNISYSGFSYQDDLYIYEPSDNQVYKFANETWEPYVLFPGTQPLLENAFFVLDGKLYSFGGRRTSSQVWTFDFALKKWEQLPPLPFELVEKDSTVVFITEDRFYFITRNRQVWKYDESKPTRLRDFPVSEPASIYSMNIQSDVHVLTSNRTFKYTPTDDTWAELNPNSAVKKYSSCVTFNSGDRQLAICDALLYEYFPNSDSWAIIDIIPVCNESFGSDGRSTILSTFQVNSQAYLLSNWFYKPCGAATLFSFR